VSDGKRFKLEGCAGVNILSNPRLGPYLSCLAYVVSSLVVFHLWPMVLLFFLFHSGFVEYISYDFYTTYFMLSLGFVILVILPVFFQSAAFQTNDMSSFLEQSHEVAYIKREMVYFFIYLFLLVFIAPLFFCLISYPIVLEGFDELSDNFLHFQSSFEYQKESDKFLSIHNIGIGLVLIAYYYFSILFLFKSMPTNFKLYFQQTIWRIAF